MSKILSITNPFAIFGGKTTTGTGRASGKIAFTPQAVRSVAVSSRVMDSVIHGSVSKTQEWMLYALVAVNVLLLGSYVVSINSSAASGYEITKLQRSIHSLTEDGKKLTLQNAEFKSMATLHEAMLVDGYVPVSEAEYIQLPNHLTQR